MPPLVAISNQYINGTWICYRILLKNSMYRYHSKKYLKRPQEYRGMVKLNFEH